MLIDLNATATAINGESDPEKLLLKDIIAKIRQFISDQSTLRLFLGTSVGSDVENLSIPDGKA